MIYDIFHFQEEIDCLEIRLNELYDVVDKFIIIETEQYITNYEIKKLYFKENKNKFKNFEDKIIYITIDVNLYNHILGYLDRHHKIFDDCIKSLKLKPNDLIILGEVYEIPRKETVLKCINSNKINQIELLRYTSFYNNFNEKKWYATKILKYKYFDGYSDIFGFFDEHNKRFNLIENGGWFFENILHIDQLPKYLKGFVHSLFFENGSLDDIYNFIKQRYDNNLDYHGNELKSVPIVSGLFPDFLVNNKNKYMNFVLKYGIFPGKNYFSTLDFSQKELYKYICKNCNNNSNFLKIGDYTGEATQYLNYCIKMSGKNINLNVYEDFERNEQKSIEYIKEIEDSRYNMKLDEIFNDYCREYEGKFDITYDLDSCLSKKYDFIFIDYEKDKNNTKNLFLSFISNLNEGGIIAGKNDFGIEAKDFGVFDLEIEPGQTWSFSKNKINKVNISNRICVGFELSHGIGDIIISMCVIRDIIEKYYNNCDLYIVLFLNPDYDYNYLDIFDIKFDKVINYKKTDNLYQYMNDIKIINHFENFELWRHWDILSYNMNKKIPKINLKIDKINLRYIVDLSILGKYQKINTVQPYTANKENIISSTFWIPILRDRWNNLFDSKKDELFILIGGEKDKKIGNFNQENVISLIGETNLKQTCEIIISCDYHYALESWTQVFCSAIRHPNKQYWDFESFPINKPMVYF